mmetsp:Transcript_21114/g.54879  ORF Transcript_21114/g.54879 Transcript_21114/m.54879 type:complete len:536 (-) Transcript_21114:567-2174(-)
MDMRRDIDIIASSSRASIHSALDDHRRWQWTGAFFRTALRSALPISALLLLAPSFGSSGSPSALIVLTLVTCSFYLLTMGFDGATRVQKLSFSRGVWEAVVAMTSSSWLLPLLGGSCMLATSLLISRPLSSFLLAYGVQYGELSEYAVLLFHLFPIAVCSINAARRVYNGDTYLSFTDVPPTPPTISATLFHLLPSSPAWKSTVVVVGLALALRLLALLLAQSLYLSLACAVTAEYVLLLALADNGVRVCVECVGEAATRPMKSLPLPQLCAAVFELQRERKSVQKSVYSEMEKRAKAKDSVTGQKIELVLFGRYLSDVATRRELEVLRSIAFKLGANTSESKQNRRAVYTDAVGDYWYTLSQDLADHVGEMRRSVKYAVAVIEKKAEKGVTDVFPLPCCEGLNKPELLSFRTLFNPSSRLSVWLKAVPLCTFVDVATYNRELFRAALGATLPLMRMARLEEEYNFVADSLIEVVASLRQLKADLSQLSACTAVLQKSVKGSSSGVEECIALSQLIDEVERSIEIVVQPYSDMIR